jgi:hypothetical protein
MPPGIARFDIAAGQHDRGKGPFMKMAVQRFSTPVAHPAGRRGTRRATRTGRRIRFRTHDCRSYTSPSPDRKVIVDVPCS